MIYKRGLKNVTFRYNSETKLFAVLKNDNSPELTKAEACAFSRFVFSMVQYYSHPKRKKALTVSEPFEGSGDKVKKG